MKDGAGNAIDAFHEGVGGGIQTVYKGDGTELWTSFVIPDSVIAHWAADDLEDGFDEWVDRESGLMLDNFGASYTTDGINDNPSVFFDGVDDFLLGPDEDELDLTSNEAEVTVGVVYEYQSSDIGYMMYMADSTNFTNQLFSMFFDGGLDDVRLGTASNENFGVGDEVNEPHTVATTYSRLDEDGTIGINGAETDANVGGESDRGVDHGLYVGARTADEDDETATTVHWEGLVGDIIVAEGRSIDDYRAINDYLGDKYGIVLE